MLRELDETASTNDDAAALARAGAPHGEAVLARRQTRGRGRAGRSFVSPEGGLYLSIVVRPGRPPDEWSLLPLAAGLAVVEELRARGFGVALKWPNDVLLEERKLAGVLVESRWGQEPFAIVGIGLNLETSPVPDATCLAAHGAAPAPRELAEALVARLLAIVARWNEAGRGAVLDGARAACVTLGRRVEWEKGEGLALDIAEDGALLVRTDEGERRVVASDVRIR